jgi:NAD(P)H-dependent FMN reductase
MNKKIHIIIGSTRPNRIGDTVAKWVDEHVKAADTGDFEIVDLADWKLPMLDEPVQAMVGEYTQDHTKKWGEKVQTADGFIIVTPEYNAGYPASLKNALDYLYKEWNDKPVGFVGYGWGGGQDAVRHLRDVVARLKMNALQAQVSIVFTQDTHDENRQIADPKKALEPHKAELVAMIEELQKTLS